MPSTKFRPTAERPHMFNVRLSAEEDAMLADIAARANKTCSDLIREFIRSEYAKTSRKRNL